MRPSKLAASALFMLSAATVCAPTYAEEGMFNGFFFNVDANSGSAKAPSTKVDTFGAGGGAGVYINNDFFIQADFSQNILDDGDHSVANIFKGMAGLEYPIEDGIASYIAGGGYYMSSSDYDESSSGLALSVGLTYGSPRYRFLIHYDHLEGGRDELVESVGLFGIGLRIQLGGDRSRTGNNTYNRDSLSDTTACEDKHKHLFEMCNKDNQR